MSQPRVSTAVTPSGVPLQAIFPGTSEAVSVTAASAQSSAFAEDCGLIRVAVSTNCFAAFGTNPTATTSGIYLPAGSVEYFAVIPGQKIALIRSTADGFASVTQAMVIA